MKKANHIKKAGQVKKTGLLKAYSGVTRVIAPALPLWLKHRAQNGKEDPLRLNERNGISNIDRPDGPLIWLHAASVGESQMLMPIVNRMLALYPHYHIVITTGTVTSAELLEKQLPDNALHQYAPADHPKAVRNFLDHWQPSMAIFAESELWPNMILMTKERNIPLALLNARMSTKSIQGWEKRGKKSGQVLLSCFDLILAADTATADGLSWLTGKDIASAGNLKDAAPILPVDDKALKTLKAAIGRRPIWAAASTHKGEEEHIAQAVLDIKTVKPNALLILAPRHPERAKDVKEILTKAGLTSIRYSSGRMPTEKTDVFIMDKIGYMGLVYRLAEISFIGGSLLKGLAGHNPLEPARLGSAIITGHQISSFADAYMALLTYGGCRRISETTELAPAILALFKDVKTRKAQIDSALKYAQSRDAVLDYVWDQLDPLLPKPTSSVGDI
ncbi:MAG: 3-deoxy-D-manno-octulosonic acid transferase [Robiginitomaculum sp.]|nr:MAG: 3-deoxy-D-manno-octulosonic acid transferase [Robiginitomaculum sp.]